MYKYKEMVHSFFVSFVQSIWDFLERTNFLVKFMAVFFYTGGQMIRLCEGWCGGGWSFANAFPSSNTVNPKVFYNHGGIYT